VYGDIGMSPLYAFRVALEATGDLSRSTVVGVEAFNLLYAAGSLLLTVVSGSSL
jgi:K+ transporter